MYICIWIGVDIEEEVMLSTHYASHNPCLYSLSGSVGIPTVNPEYIVHSQSMTPPLAMAMSLSLAVVFISCCFLFFFFFSPPLA